MCVKVSLNVCVCVCVCVCVRVSVPVKKGGRECVHCARVSENKILTLILLSYSSLEVLVCA